MFQFALRPLRRWLLAGSLAATSTACAASAAPPADARAAVAAGATLLDVRTPGEYAAGHLPGAINIPIDQLPVRLGDLVAAAPIVVYCRSGRRSAAAARILAGDGRAVVDLGAMSNW